VTEEGAWFVGVERASQSHQFCLVSAGGEGLAERADAHGGAGIRELCDWLLACTAARAEAIAAAMEVPHGPVVEALLERGLLVSRFVAPSLRPRQRPRAAPDHP